ncbi:MAG: hypothetical protein V3V31_07590 [Methylococcales bacterium]
MDLSRRQLLILFAGLPWLAGCSLLKSKSGGEADDEQLGRHLISSLTDLPSARIIGRSYYESLKQQPDRPKVVQVLAERLSGNKESVIKLDREALRRQIHSQYREEYLAGQTVELQGWLLARTEVELCLLVVLLRDSLPVHSEG